MESQKGKRGPNWTEREELVLAEEVEKRISIIDGKFSSSLTKENKKQAWIQVADAVNRYVTYGCIVIVVL